MAAMRWEDVGEVRRIQFAGELDHEGCGAIEQPFEQAVLAFPSGIAVDLGDVTFIGTEGIRLLLRTERTLRDAGRALQLCNLPPHIRRLFETVGVFRVIPEQPAAGPG